MGRPKSATSSTQALALSEDEKKRRNASLDTAGSMIGSADAAIKDFYGSGMDNWKRNQVNTRTADTTKSFNDALAGSRLRARTAGFGYEQPAEQAGETNIENARADALAKIPGQVETEAIPIEMQAIGEEGNLAGAEMGIARTYDPQSYYGSAVNQDQAAAERRKSLWQSIIGGVTSVGSKLVKPF
jgi:hypothetical protein